MAPDRGVAPLLNRGREARKVDMDNEEKKNRHVPPLMVETRVGPALGDKPTTIGLRKGINAVTDEADAYMDLNGLDVNDVEVRTKSKPVDDELRVVCTVRKTEESR